MTAPDTIWTDHGSNEWANGAANAYHEPSAVASEPYHHQRTVDELVEALECASALVCTPIARRKLGLEANDERVELVRALIAKHRKGSTDDRT